MCHFGFLTEAAKAGGYPRSRELAEQKRQLEACQSTFGFGLTANSRTYKQKYHDRWCKLRQKPAITVYRLKVKTRVKWRQLDELAIYNKAIYRAYGRIDNL